MRALAGLLLVWAVSAHGAISGTVVEYGAESGSGTSLVVDGSSDVTYSNASVTAGDLGIAACSIDGENVDHTITLPSGFAEIQGHHGSLAFQNQYVLGWKVLTGSETSFTFSIATSSADWACAVAVFDQTDLDLTGVDASNEDVSLANSGGTSSATGSATNSTANSLVIYLHTYERSDFMDGSRVYSAGTEQLEVPATANANTGFVIATEVTSSTGSQSNTLSVTDSGSRTNGAVAIFAEGASAPTVSLSDASPDIDTTVTATLSEAFGAGGNPTLVTLASGDTVACSAATSTTCEFPLDSAEFVASGDLSDTQAEVATSLTVTNGTETSQSTAVNIQVPASGWFFGDVACNSAACPDDSLFHDTNGVATMQAVAVNDDYLCRLATGAGTMNDSGVLYTAGDAIAQCRHFDESGGAWSGESALDDPNGIFTAPASECIQSVAMAVQSVLKQWTNQPQCLMRHGGQ